VKEKKLIANILKKSCLLQFETDMNFYNEKMSVSNAGIVMYSVGVIQMRNMP